MDSALVEAVIHSLVVKRRYCHAGYDDRGRPLFVEHGKDGTEVRTFCGALEEGKPIDPDQHVALITPEADGKHVTMEDVDLHSGPVRVNSKAYRSGWDRTFN